MIVPMEASVIPRTVPAAALLFSTLAVASCDTRTEPETSGSQPAIAPALAVASNSWIRRADLPSTERWDLAAATVNAAGQSIVYAIGGRTATWGSLSKVQAYNAATNTWTHKAPLPVPLYWSNGAGVIGGKIYISGGLSGYKEYRSSLYVYNPATNTWTQKRDMPNSSFRGVTGVSNNLLYVATGCDQEDCLFYEQTALYRYNPVTDRWTRLASPPTANGLGSGGFIGGKFYVTRGGGELDVYDPATNQWTSRARMPLPQWRAAGVTMSAKLYVIGGYQTNADGTFTLSVRTAVYDPATNTWTTQAPLPSGRADIAASRVSVNGKPRINVVGGRPPGNNLQYIP